MAGNVFLELQPNVSADEACCAVVCAVHFKIIILRVWDLF